MCTHHKVETIGGDKLQITHNLLIAGWRLLVEKSEILSVNKLANLIQFQNCLSYKESQQLQRGAVFIDLRFQPNQQIHFWKKRGQAFFSTWGGWQRHFVGWCMGNG